MGRLSQFENNNNEKTKEDEIKEKFETFKGMNKNELNSELYKEVARQKSCGTFDYNKLSAMVDNLKGTLPEGDYNNIKRILESLK